jgi:alginate O-acetyltransferase complex protein AlgI
MLFHSYGFIFIFLPVSFFVYFYLNHKKLTEVAKGWVVFASLFFYGWWNITYLPLILVSILCNYTITNLMKRRDNELRKVYVSKKVLLIIGLALNIGLLAYFKYMDFFISNTNNLIGTDIELLYLALPLAISFFTLQQIAFLIDSYEDLINEKSLLDYMLFVTFFPQLIAGPIVHHKEIIPQFKTVKNKVKNYRNIGIGLFVFSIGLFKKIVIADNFATVTTPGFDAGVALNLIDGWVTSLSYTFQLYFDFSGYADMAIGAALLFNIRIPQNFNSPYKATGMVDFWKRWHITLTNFITTYIYTPIIRSFDSLTFHKAMAATIIAFLIAGLWHGASWMFVIFGGLNGAGIVINHYWKKTKLKMNKILAWIITFNFVNITFVFFRAKDLDSAERIILSMVGYGENLSQNSYESYLYLSAIVLAIIFVVFLKNTHELVNNFKFSYLYLLYTAMILTISLGVSSDTSEFLYFNF